MIQQLSQQKYGFEDKLRFVIGVGEWGYVSYSFLSSPAMKKKIRKKGLLCISYVPKEDHKGLRPYSLGIEFHQKKTT